MEDTSRTHQIEDIREEDGDGQVSNEQLSSLAHSQLNINNTVGLSPSASSILRVLLPSLTKLDGLLESVWDKQDALNEVINRLAAELEQFDELIVPPGVSPQMLSAAAAAVTTGGVGGAERTTPPSSVGLATAQRLRDSRTRVMNINATLKKVRSRLDNISMLAQAKILQNQQQQQKQTHHHRSLSPPKKTS
ncbi:hypothetical protein GGI21_000161 [Coemansia aciculifera]|nr:hypothetical protein GGI21_000161 [Coemansia aciculifera]